MLGAARAVAILLCLSALAAILNAQPRVDSRNSYERIFVVLPLIGTGTVEDPIRPSVIPSPQSASPTALSVAPAGSQSRILAYTWVPSDDGKFALTEIVMRDRSAFSGIQALPGVRAFIKGVNARADIETEFKVYKKDFDLTKFGARVQ
jgi:hypothetical protein